MYRTRSLYTTAGFTVNQNLHWEMLTDDQAEALLMSVYELLESTGVEIKSAEVCDKLAKSGCFVEGSRVRIPTAKVEAAIRTAPSRVTLCDRDGKRSVKLQTSENHYGACYTPEMFYDQESGETRTFGIADVETFAKLAQMLPNIDLVLPGGFPVDVPEGTAELHSLKTMFQTSTKPVIQDVKSLSEAKASVAMASALAGGDDALALSPRMALHIVCDEPLLLTQTPAEVVAYAAQAGVPVIFENRLISGLTAPAESAGVMIVALANVLAALVISQSTCEGAPFVGGGFFTNNDTVNKIHPFGSPEISLLGAGFAQIMRYLRIPSAGFAGGTDSKTSDAQLGAEAAMSTLLAGLSGTNVIHGAGVMESGCASNPVLLVLADELVSEVSRIERGVEMDEDRLARGVIEDVKPGGNYLATKHTRYYFKSEQFWPTLMNRKRIDDWTVDGALSLGQRTLNKMNQLLADYEPQPLPDETVAAFDKAIADAQ